jgi:hypothetical protein
VLQQTTFTMNYRRCRNTELVHDVKEGITGKATGTAGANALEIKGVISW